MRTQPFTRVRFQAELRNGFPFPSEMFTSAPLTPLIRIRDILADSFDTFVPDWSVPEEAVARSGDIIIGMDGDFNATLWNRGEAAINQRVAAIRTSPNADARFIAYAIPRKLKEINDVTHSTTVKHLSGEQILNIQLPYHDLPTQRRIADYLDRETTQIDAMAGALDGLVARLDERRRAAITSAVCGDVQGGAGVKTVKLGYLVRFRNGQDAKNVEAPNGEYPIIGSGGTFSRANSFLHDGESLLFGRKGTIDRPLHVNRKFWTVDTMYYTEIGPETSGRYLYYWATTIPFDTISTQTALPSMTSFKLSQLKVPLPDLPTQRHIADHLDAETAKIDAMIAKAGELRALLDERRSALITATVTGQHPVPQEP